MPASGSPLQQRGHKARSLQAAANRSEPGSEDRGESGVGTGWLVAFRLSACDSILLNFSSSGGLLVVRRERCISEPSGCPCPCSC